MTPTPKEIKEIVVQMARIPYCDFTWNKNMVNILLRRHHRPSYVKAGLLILLWWNTHRPKWIEVEIEDAIENQFFERGWETPPTSFFYQEWSKACKKAGLHVA